MEFRVKKYQQGEVVHKLGNYSIVFVHSVEDSGPGFQVVNSLTDAPEVETKILPQALKYLVDLNAGLDAMIDMINEPVAKQVDKHPTLKTVN